MKRFVISYSCLQPFTANILLVFVGIFHKHNICSCLWKFSTNIIFSRVCGISHKLSKWEKRSEEGEA